MSSNLSDKKCIACEGGVPPLTSLEITEFQEQLSIPWKVEGVKKITREFKFKDFKQAMDFVNRIAEIAEAESHHPDLRISYNKVAVELWTHAIGGLSENDFIMAAKIEKIVPLVV